MNQNLKKLEKELRNFAKRCKNVKYTKALLLSFLMSGVLSFGTASSRKGELDSIKNAKSELGNSIAEMKKLFKDAKKENAKLIRSSNLELIQLMEQGDHVIKSPWSTWQIGMGYTYDSWLGSYKGRGDKDRALEGKEFPRLMGRSRYIQSTSGGKYGTTDLELAETAEPVIEITVSAAIKPKSINKQAPAVTLPPILVPSLPTLNVSMPSPVAVTPNAPNPPVLNLRIPNPNADSFVRFGLAELGGSAGYEGYATSSDPARTNIIQNMHATNTVNTKAWSGVKIKADLSGIDTDSDGNPIYSSEAGYRNMSATGIATSTLAAAQENYTERHPAIYYQNYGRWCLTSTGFGCTVSTPGVIDGGVYHLAGNVDGSTLIESNTGYDGTALVYTKGDVTLKNLNVNLYGRAAFLLVDAFHGNVIQTQNNTINIYARENTIFAIAGRNEAMNDIGRATHAPVQNSYVKGQYVTKFSGNTDITINHRNNTVYTMARLLPGFRLENTGTINLNSASNVLFSLQTWVPDKSKYIGNIFINHASGLPADGEGPANEYKPYIKVDPNKPINVYGDENVGLFMTRYTDPHTGLDPLYDPRTFNTGMHQGKIELYMNIGKNLNSNTSLTEQTAEGNLETDIHGNPTGYSNKKADANVAVYVQSGQRTGIDMPSLYTPTCGSYNCTHFDLDPIHNLEFEDFKIAFGKYSSNGFMFLAKNGSVIEVKNTGMTNFSDGINGTATKETEAGEGTVVSYAEGIWTASGTGLTSTASAALENKPTEVIVNKPLNMMSKNGKAFYAKAGGKVTVNANAKAYGYGSIVGLAESGPRLTTLGATVNINADVEALDDIAVDTGIPNRTNIVKAQKFKNIGAYAKSHNGKDTVVTVAAGKNVKVNGIGGYAEGEGAKVVLNGTGNVINTGTNGGLYAANKGIVEFGGGTIVNKDQGTAVDPATGAPLLDADNNPINDHKNTTPFYAKTEMVDHDGNPLTPDIPVSGKIIFKDTDGNANNPDTLIEMYDGILVYGKGSDYLAGINPTSSEKYQGMNNVKVKLMNNGVNLGVFEELTPTWDGNDTTYLATLRAIPKFKEIDANGKKYVTTLTKGTLTVDTDVNLSSTTDKFNDILMEREKVVINAGKTVTGTRKGLSMGSNADALSNAESGYTNKGTVNITGGTVAAGVAGINVAYGTVHNDTGGTVTVDNGAGLYGTNGSRLVNDGAITVTGTGAGIAGISKGTVTYGDRKIDITNNGTISIAGDNGIGIYANSNDGAAQGDIVINNNKPINLGTGGVGIAVKGSNGGIINIGGTGNISVGAGGIGIYAENSKVVLNADVEIETKENGVGIYTLGTSETAATGKTLTYKYSGTTTGTGIGMIYGGINSSNGVNVVLNNSVNTTGGMVGILAKGTGIFTNTGTVTGTSSRKELGIVSENTAVVNNGTITLGSATGLSEANVGIYSKTSHPVTNTGTVTVGDNSIGVYGYSVTSSGNISTGKNGIGIYSMGGDLTLGGSISAGTDEAVGIFTEGRGQTVTSTSDMSIGDKSYGYVIKGSDTVMNVHDANGLTVGNDTVYVYSSDRTGNITNRTNLTSTGKNNYGLYTSGTTVNHGNIDFSSSTGNVGIYAVEGYASNGDGLGSAPIIRVSGSDVTSRNPDEKYYGIGMAAGYLNEKSGTIENYGTIQVTKDGSIGMYASGTGSRAINRGTIELSGKGVVGMYLDNNAVGENYGVIRSVPNSENSGIVGVAALNGSLLKNYGQIIIDAPESVGVYHTGGRVEEQPGSTITVTGEDSERTRTAVLNDTSKGVKGITINTSVGRMALSTSNGSYVVTRLGEGHNPVRVDTSSATPGATQVTVGGTVLNVSDFSLSENRGSMSSEIGMYVDTSGVRYTNPIQGVEHLTGLKKVNLIFGIEASLYTDSRDIEIGSNILAPYNDAIREVSSRRLGGDVKWLTRSSSLTWIATPVQNRDQTISKVYLSKIPYVSFAKDEQTYRFMEGLEQRYGVERRGSRERKIYEKLNEIGKGEAYLLAQAVDQMKGHQYSNIQHRVYSTGRILDSEIWKLSEGWKNTSKDSNKITTFGTRGEYSTDTAGVIDYRNNAYGFAYVHENEGVKLGNTTGWYAGAVNNNFRFKDIGKSKENQTMVKAGIFKIMTPKNDHNGSLKWKISGEGYVSRNSMHRRYLVVDEVFSAKGDYTSYGAGVKNELSKEIRAGERFSIRPYGSLKVEYGRYSGIKEKTGEMKLDVKGDDYISVRPEVGTEFIYRRPVAQKSTFVASLGAGYSSEIGQVDGVKNRVKLQGTSSDYYRLNGEKENRKGSLKADFKVGLENTRFGVTFNAGYDTKGQNVNGGIGFRVIY